MTPLCCCRRNTARSTERRPPLENNRGARAVVVALLVFAVGGVVGRQGAWVSEDRQYTRAAGIERRWKRKSDGENEKAFVRL